MRYRGEVKKLRVSGRQALNVRAADVCMSVYVKEIEENTLLLYHVVYIYIAHGQVKCHVFYMLWIWRANFFLRHVRSRSFVAHSRVFCPLKEKFCASWKRELRKKSLKLAFCRAESELYVCASVNASVWMQFCNNVIIFIIMVKTVNMTCNYAIIHVQFCAMCKYTCILTHIMIGQSDTCTSIMMR